MLFLGVDPGAVSGAFAVLDESTLLMVDDLPTIASGKLKWVDGPALLSRILEIRAGKPMVAMVERQSARPGQGLSSTFTSACAFGALLATLQIAGCSLELVTPVVWKSATGAIGRDKGASLDAARRLYPEASLDRKRDHGRAEAILLARYALRQRNTPKL